MSECQDCEGTGQSIDMACIPCLGLGRLPIRMMPFSPEITENCWFCQIELEARKGFIYFRVQKEDNKWGSEAVCQKCWVRVSKITGDGN